jgi:hypothetical protein
MFQMKESRLKVFANGIYYGTILTVLMQTLAYNIQGNDVIIKRLQYFAVKYSWWYHVGWSTVLISVIFLIWTYSFIFDIIKYRKENDEKHI